MTDTLVCPKCGSTNFIKATTPGGLPALRCRPGCESVWDEGDLSGTRFRYLHDQHHEVPVDDTAPAVEAANEPSAEVAWGEGPEAA